MSVTLEQLEKERMEKGKELDQGGDDPKSDKGKEVVEEEDEKKKSRRTGEGIGMDSLLDLELIRKDTARVYPIIYYTLKGLMEDWEKSLADRPSKYPLQQRSSARIKLTLSVLHLCSYQSKSRCPQQAKPLPPSSPNPLPISNPSSPLFAKDPYLQTS